MSNNDHDAPSRDDSPAPSKPERVPNGTVGRVLAAFWRQEMVHLTVTLFLFAAVMAGLMAAVNAVTAEPIANYKAEAVQRAMASVQPDAEFVETALPASFSDPSVTAFYTSLRDGQTAGYVAAVTVQGFKGAINMVVGLTPDGDVLGVAITDMSETPGLGTKAAEPDWLTRYAGKTAGLKVGNGTGNTVEAISGATVTSETVTAGVVSALAAAAALLSGGGNP